MTNTRTHSVKGPVINGVSAGGATAVMYEEGYDEIIESAGDGHTAKQKDRTNQFVRGTIATEDWTKIISMLTGAVDDFVVYENESGKATYLKHTFSKPVVYAISLQVQNGSYATIAAKFECRASAETDTIVNLHATDDGQTLPAGVFPGRGGIRINSALLGALAISHIKTLSLDITFGLLKSNGDDDIAYTAVDRLDDNVSVTGSIEFEAGFSGASLLSQQLLIAAAADLVFTVTQAGGTAQKTITIKRAIFNTNSGNMKTKGYAANTMPFTITDDGTLTLDGAVDFIQIADVA